MSDFIAQFIGVLRAAGCGPANSADISADDTRRRYRIEGESAHKRSGSYQLAIDNEFAYGRYYDFRTGQGGGWSSKSDNKLTAADLKEWESKKEACAERQAKEEEKSQRQAEILANKLWRKAFQSGITPYIKRKGIELRRARVMGDSVLVPVYDEGRLVNLQVIGPDGTKRFLKYGRKGGCASLLYNPGYSKDTIIVCEGWATGVSIHLACPHHMVVVAFDAGNIKPVVDKLLQQHTTSKIIIAADNDQWRMNPRIKSQKYPDLDMSTIDGADPLWMEWRESGALENIGRVKAAEAAGLSQDITLVWPDFSITDPLKRTDFNDYHSLYGIDSVRTCILSSVAAAARVMDEAVSGILEPPGSDGRPTDGQLMSDISNHLDSKEGPFKVLGYNSGVYYYFPYKLKQIVRLPAAGHTLSNFLQLAPLSYWEESFATKDTSHSKITIFAANSLIQNAQSKGVFSEEDRVRGCGAWMDSGRVILHCGDMVYIDGVPCDPRDVDSYFVYVAAPRLLKPSDDELSNVDANKLRQICAMPSWENELSGHLLAGWLVIAPVCAMLKWRPHIWITGAASVGKSTVQNDIIKRVLGPIALCVEGGTTEAALRQMLKSDGRPVIYDEAEAEDAAQRSAMSGVIHFARKASSGGSINKGTPTGEAIRFQARSCFCFSGINPAIRQYADETRISMLVLKRSKSLSALQDFKDMCKVIDEVLTPEYSNRLLARILKNMDALLKNVDIFVEAATRVIGNRRAADQIGPMIAGLYLLSRTRVCTISEAEEWIRAQNWEFHTAIDETPDNMRLLQHITTSLVKIFPTGHGMREVSIGDLIVAALGKDEFISHATADKVLRQYGIAVLPRGVCISNRSPNLAKLLKDTPWTDKWNRSLSDIEGSEKVKLVHFGPGDSQRALCLPASLFLDNGSTKQYSLMEGDE